MSDKPRASQTVVDDFGDGPVLTASRCPSCGDTRYPPRAWCVNDQETMERVPVSPVGTLHEAVWVARPPYGFTEPYYVGYVDMPEGIRIFGRIDANGHELEHGTQLTHRIDVSRTEPDDVLGPIFTPVAS